MTPELKYLALASTFTALMWVPYILNVISMNKMSDAVGYPDSPLKMSPWAERLKKAHYNAVENLVVFAALVLVAHAIGLGNSGTATAAMVYFWARVAHAGAYMAAVPWLRTLAFAAAWLCIMCFAWQLLV